jgi:hypothetical protein
MDGMGNGAPLGPDSSFSWKLMMLWFSPFAAILALMTLVRVYESTHSPALLILVPALAAAAFALRCRRPDVYGGSEILFGFQLLIDDLLVRRTGSVSRVDAARAVQIFTA